MTDVSVALCTYQGERFLSAQLESISDQTVRPAEVVVSDDGSSDGTCALVRAFAAAAPFPVRLSVNPERLGVTRNFSRAISLCEGPIVALADQDDVWVPHKLERQVAVLSDRPGVGAVFSDADLVDGSLRPLGSSMFQVTHFTRRRQMRFQAGLGLQVLLARSVVCGATLVFRSSFRDLLLPIPATGLHDVWLSTLLCAVTDVVALPDRLVRYRQHDANQVGAPATSPRSKLARRRRQGVFGDEVGHHRAMAERLAAQPPSPATHQAVRLLNRKVAHLEVRYGLHPNRRARVLNDLARGRYHLYSRGMESAAYDLVFRDRPRRRAASDQPLSAP